MPPAPKVDTEDQRIAALTSLNILDSEPEVEFDGLVQVASLVLGVPISLISLIDTDRQWFKANVGLPGVSETPREQAFCAHAILDDEILEVSDATLDPRFMDNPLVLGRPDIRFYAGAPLRMSDGSNVGTLCVIDRMPRVLTEQQRVILKNLAKAAARALEGRRALLAEIQVTAALEASEARFRALSESAPIGIFAMDGSGSRTYVNPKWQDIFGLTSDEAMGTGWKRVVHPNDLVEIEREAQHAIELRRDFTMPYRITRPDGQTRNIRSRARPIFDAEEHLVAAVGTIEDVTEQRIMLERLTASENRLRRLYEATPAIMHSVDIDGHLIAVSDKWIETFGYSREEVIGLAAREMLTPQSRFYMEREVVPTLLARGYIKDVEYQFVCKDGRILDILLSAIVEPDDLTGSGTRLAVMEDITEKKRAEQALANANQRFQMAADSGGIGIWDLDLCTSELIWDDWMYRLHGLERTDQPINYDTWVACVHPDDLPVVNAIVESVINTADTFEAEFRVVWRSGEIRHIRTSARITRGADGIALRFIGANWDITEQRQLAAQLARQHELLRVTMKSIGDGVITTDDLGHVTWMNPMAERMTGWAETDAQGRPLRQVFHIIHEESREPYDDPVALCLAGGTIVGNSNHTILVSRHGDEYGVEDSAAPIRDETGHVLGVVLVFRDLTEKRRLAGEMGYRTAHDPLTGLVSRHEFESRLRRLFLDTHEDRSEHVLLHIDLDHFKEVNTAGGQAVGDKILMQIATLLKSLVRGRDTVARLGGDEIGIILEGCPVAIASRIADAICERLDGFRFVHEDLRFRVGASIGLVPVDNRWSTLSAILQAGEAACLQAKASGTSRVQVWHDGDIVIRSAQSETQWMARIERAIETDGFVLYAQRLFSLGAPTNGIRAEIMVRKTQRDGGLTPSETFMPAAERFNLAAGIDRWVLTHAIEWLNRPQRLARIAQLSITLSGQSIGDRTFHRFAVETLKAAGDAVCTRLALEIPESIVLSNPADASLLIEQLRELGCQIVLDRFGTSNSAHGYLKTLQVDMLKIDGQFIQTMADVPFNDALMHYFVAIARISGLKTGATRLDNPALLPRLAQVGIDFAQGDGLHAPEPIDSLMSDVPPADVAGP